MTDPAIVSDPHGQPLPGPGIERLAGLSIDLLCQVIDNFGDAGICWRLARQLTDETGARVTLWIDRPEILAPWRHQAPSIDIRDSALLRSEPPHGRLLIAAIGAELPARLRQHIGGHAIPWIRYEYLTAEPWIDGFHGLPSIKPADGATEWYFYPGFSDASGGLLRERDFFSRQAAFGGAVAARWRIARGLDSRPGALRATLFGYAGDTLARLIDGFAGLDQPFDLFIARSIFEALGRPPDRGRMRIVAHDWLDQDDFDRLLWSSDLNLVRGEESYIRAQWAGKPMIWQPYQQQDGAHRIKLEAFMDRLLAVAGDADAGVVRALMRAMSGEGDPALCLRPLVARLPTLNALATTWRAQLALQPPLLDRLCAFIDARLAAAVATNVHRSLPE
ncbi:MAG: elongation factor P maturation arginine rhamnosyltransferase EarP [Burkholderiaceae bacterium]